MAATYRFTAELWEYPGDAAWHFVTVPGEQSDDIASRSPAGRRGFGAVKVRVTIGATTWETSVFPDSKLGSYVLPVKKPVRTAEGIQAGDKVKVTLALVTR